VEIQECRDRIEDAVFAVRAALEDGYVIGGGFGLIQCSQYLDFSLCENIYQKIGFEIV
jgi:chaperonin GroEL